MLRSDFNELQVGDWCFMNDGTYIGIRLHEGDWGSCILPIIKNGDIPFVDRTIAAKPWLWNGNKEFPTLIPSILHWGSGRKEPATWHGYLTDGKLVEV
jgi:alpha-N-acetylglucosamine transferase